VTALASRRRLAAIAAVAIVIAQLASFAHRAAVRHVVCAEHNELVEVPAELVQQPLSIDHGSLSSRDNTPGHADDVHCELACGFGPHVATMRALLPVVVPTITLPAPTFARADTAPPILALYRLAPKTSPPHHAV
jgi:hypothetical protein